MIKITAPKQATWQSAYNHLVSTNRNRATCNLMFKTGDYRLVPWGAADPQDWDVIIPGAYLAVSRQGRLNVDSGGPDNPELTTSAIGEERRTLMDCFRHALRDHYLNTGEHYHKVHPSWYDWVLEDPICPNCGGSGCWECDW